MQNENRPQNYGPKHYRSNEVQPIDYILQNGLDFCEGNVIKYITRWREKGGVEDLQKAKHYIEFLIAEEVRQADMYHDEDEIYAPEFPTVRRPVEGV